MYPSKNMYDYMNEINRLFPRHTENDVPIRPELPPTHYTSSIMSSPFSNSTMANHSSSSADSISPEVFPHMSPPPPPIRLMDTRSIPVKHAMSETPFPAKRQRPIVGRRILGCNDQPSSYESQVSPITSMDTDMIRWQEVPNFPQTPPNSKVLVEQKNYCQNVLYELFPTESRGFEFRTPVKAPTRAPSFACSSNISPNSNISVSPTSSTTYSFPTPPPLYRRNITNNHFSGPSSSRAHYDINPEKICTFCRKNGETPLVYMTHTVKEMIGNRHVVTCPILRSHVCSTCGASGDDAHTITYCPVLRSSNNGRPLQSTTITLKNTRVKSNGRKRY